MKRKTSNANLYHHSQYGACHGSDPRSMPKIFDELADYNSRVANGIVHEVDYAERMGQLQNEFDLWMQEIRKQADPPPLAHS